MPEYSRERSKQAFKSLAAGKEGLWVGRWDAFVRRAVDSRPQYQGGVSFIDQLRSDTKGLALHDDVQKAVTVRTKLRAIKKALAYLEPLLEEFCS